MLNYWLNWVVMTDIKQALDQATTRLTLTSASPRLDAELLLSKIINQSRTYFYSHPEAVLTQIQQEQYQHVIKQRAAGQPIAYLTGTREFWSLPLNVNQDTLIPRPETELLVELMLNRLPSSSPATVLDLGTGSGAIACALALERPDWQLLAVDKSQTALHVAHHTATQLGLHNLNVLCSNWFESIPNQQFNAIVSNPPYIADNDPHLSQGDVRFEPRDALSSGTQGLDALNHIIEQSPKWLTPGGLLLLEHGFEQGVAVTTLLRENGFEQVQCWKDWQGHDRVSGGQRKS